MYRPQNRTQWRTLPVLAIALAMSVAALGCSRQDEDKRIDFSRVKPVARPTVPPSPVKSLRVAVGAMISPQQTFHHYRALLSYLGSKLGRQVNLVQRKTYGEINKLLDRGEIDLAFICSGPYAVGSKRYNLELLAAPEVQGSHFYRSYLIVNAQSPYQRLADLRGRVFAFTDPESNTGKIVPTFWLVGMNQKPETFFAQVIYTHAHDNSIMAVARGLVDGAAVDGLIWDYYHRIDPGFTAKTRIIKKSQPFGIPPVVGSRYLPALLKKDIRRVLFEMHTDSKGHKILNGLMIDRFVPAQDSWYGSVRQMLRKLQDSKGQAHVAAQP
jgi:phosphonate transport system substrate-binding protein